MPISAPKSIQSEFKQLVDHLAKGKSLGDITRYNIETKLESCKISQPSNSYCGLAFLAAIDGDEIAMRKYFNKVFEYAPNHPGYEFNFGLLLMLTNHYDEAMKAFMQSLAHGLCDKLLLDDLAKDALILGDADLQFEVLDRANKLQCTGPEILRLASLVCCVNCDDPDEQDTLLTCAFPDDELKANSELMTEQDWQHIQSFADSLRKYL